MAKKELLLFKNLDQWQQQKKTHWQTVSIKKKKAGTSKSKTKSSIRKNTYNDMKKNWGN